ncbi:hypothetical protein BJ878DRAFT_430286 [Calycina marina]|uniref:DUF21-domain-containing protein n=1 Tax=Calycina marina TaxID=1763456 RepID=A0A9P7YVD4_9HELO|nr:hypothetical protein BJ878DRAFT_430286 [Calycina marina]
MVEEESEAEGASLWLYLGVALLLVLGGGIFAGLTIALMGQDEINLAVLHGSGEPNERKQAGKVLKLLKRGKHWVLVTLLLSNVITNETLPIVLDRSLGGGWPAVVGSTALIVIFGEVIPQSICVRYGLPIGAAMAPIVLALMWIMSPIAWPTAKLLDCLLGEDHGTVYKKAGLKTLVTLHQSLGTSPGERLNEDEVTIITAVLDLKAKSVASIMTPINDMFIMASDTILDEKTVATILAAGYSRIPIHTPGKEKDFVGMLLVRTLITYDPEDATSVCDFTLATLPETKPDTSCLDIINFFQEGHSHMVLVSSTPGEAEGAIGVVTLEDVIEELIGEEIMDESDVIKDPNPDGDPKTVPEGEIARPKRQNTGMSFLVGKKVKMADEHRQYSPQNRASEPKETKNPNIKIKPARTQIHVETPHGHVHSRVEAGTSYATAASIGSRGNGEVDERTSLLGKK